MHSLIKWPGGKTSEYNIIKQFIPQNYDKYIEPFFGGGAVFFNMAPQKNSIINDISENLINFYRYIQSCNSQFKNYLYALNDDWQQLKMISEPYVLKLCECFISLRNNDITVSELRDVIDHSCRHITDLLLESSKIMTEKNLIYNELFRMVSDKTIRTLSNELKHDKQLSQSDLICNITTGFMSGYYMCIRSVFNSFNRCQAPSCEYKTALFYFVREFCYGSMFRYNKFGEFNIPYGGIAYNNKDFKRKIDILFSQDVQNYLKNTQIFNTDFSEILDMAQVDDFVFIDPPYDTDFSEYENKVFNENDQRRLALKLHTLPAKFLLIIKNTPLIDSLYSNLGYNIYAFDNRYSYCVKGRNDRNAVHLIITNY